MGGNASSHAKPGKRAASRSRDRAARGGQGQAPASASRAPVWAEPAREDYLWWQQADAKVFGHINALLEDILGSPDDIIPIVHRHTRAEERANGQFARRSAARGG